MTAEGPVVLCLSGHDPTGGAGVQADAESVAALGGHAVTVVTAHTVQDSNDVRCVVAADPVLLAAQCERLLADFAIGAVKIGLLADAAQPALIAGIARRTKAPLVLDPVLRAGGGAELATAPLVAALRRELFPLTEVLTPNALEARRLAGDHDLDRCGAALLAHGCRNVFITGGDEPGDAVVNRWYAPGRSVRRYAWPRLPGGFHGAGCTLAAAIAALLAVGAPVAQALEDAQAFTHRALAAARPLGRGRRLPWRLRP